MLSIPGRGRGGVWRSGRDGCGWTVSLGSSIFPDVPWQRLTCCPQCTQTPDSSHSCLVILETSSPENIPALSERQMSPSIRRNCSFLAILVVLQSCLSQDSWDSDLSPSVCLKPCYSHSDLGRLFCPLQTAVLKNGKVIY